MLPILPPLAYYIILSLRYADCSWALRCLDWLAAGVAGYALYWTFQDRASDCRDDIACDIIKSSTCQETRAFHSR